MKHDLPGIILFALTLLILPACKPPSGQASEAGKTFYISVSGDDEAAGTSPDKPWKSIDRVNRQEFNPGDRILFKSGDRFEGTIVLDGNEDGPGLLVSSYGEGRALIAGMQNEGVIADSCRHLSIENLDFEGAGRKDGNSTDGVIIKNSFGISVHQVEVSGFQHSGIRVHRCDSARITHVYAHENGFAGIHVTGSTMRDADQYDNHNLYIGYCVAENNPGDPTVLENHSGNGILASSVKGGTIEYCEAFNNGWDMIWTGNGPVGIWIWDCTDCTVQYCIAHHNRTNPAAADGGGFDFDGGVSNSVIQYCIAHNNEGAGFGLYEFGAAKAWENNTVRYNISYNDGIINGGSMGIWKDEERGVMRNCQIYNNTFYNSLEPGENIWLYDHYPGFEFRNNVFVYHGALVEGGKSLREEVFEGNLYWNLSADPAFQGYGTLREWAQATGHEWMDGSFSGIYEDPLLRNPESMELTDPELINRTSLEGYYPETGSPLINRGLDLNELFGIHPGDKDLVGSRIPQGGKYDIGALETEE